MASEKKYCLTDEECDGGEVPKYCSLLTGTCEVSLQKGDACASTFDTCGVPEDSAGGKALALFCQNGRCRVPNQPQLGLEQNANVAGLYCQSNRDCEQDEFCDVEGGGVCKLYDPEDDSMQICPNILGLVQLEMKRQNKTDASLVTDVYYNIQGACRENELCDFVEAGCKQRCRVPEKPYDVDMMAKCSPSEICDPQCPNGQLCASFEHLFSYSSLPVDPFLPLDHTWKRASNPEEQSISMGLCVNASRIKPVAGVLGSENTLPKNARLKVTMPTTPVPTEEQPVESAPIPDQATSAPEVDSPPLPIDEASDPNEESKNTNLLYITIGAGLGGVLVLTLIIYLIVWSRKRSSSSKGATAPYTFDAGHSGPSIPASPVYMSAPSNKKGTAMFSDSMDEAVPAYVPPAPGSNSYMPDYKKPL